MGNSCIDFSLTNIWQSWYKFKVGKKRTREFEFFAYYLEGNLRRINCELEAKTYRHGGYRSFVAVDNKKRKISVASVRDRVIHRLAYEYLVNIFDKNFQYDTWSCRKNKGLIAAIKRTQKFANKYRDCFVWRADIKKFFDNINHKVLLTTLQRKIKDGNAIWLLEEIISSYSVVSQFEIEREGKRGLPIGNLTSQIFANIYHHELDRFVRRNQKPKTYLRYGDDFVVFEPDLEKLRQIR